MKIKVQFKHYKRPFCKPLKTAYGTLSSREGIIIKLEDKDGHYGFGEIAPLFFGTETLSDARKFCQTIGTALTEKQISAIPSELPCCQYGFQSAYNFMLTAKTEITHNPLATVGLSACNPVSIIPLISRGFQYIKVKIGVNNPTQEMKVLQSIFEVTPQSIRFRLDANEGLTIQITKKWLTFLEHYLNIDFLEQPLPKGQEKEMAHIAKDFNTPLALDESVTIFINLAKLDKLKWNGFIVIKPSFLGNLQAFLKWRHTTHHKLIYSPAFETDFGLFHLISLALSDSKNNYGLSLGSIDYFPKDGYHQHPLQPYIIPSLYTSTALNHLWQSL